MVAKRRKILLISNDSGAVLPISEAFRQAGYDIIATADSSMGLILAQKHTPELMIIDISLGLEGFELIFTLRQSVEFQQLPVVLLSDKRETSERRIKSLRLGVDIYLMKPFEPQELIVLVALLFSSRPEKLLTPERDLLTATERAVLAHVAMGMLNKEIAQTMYISTRTVESHIRNMLRKTDMPNRTALVRWAMDSQAMIVRQDP